MPDNQELPDIQANRIDHIVTGLKALSGLAPVVGSLVAEAIGAIIPNQRIDRLALYVSILEQTLRDIDRELLKARFASPGFLDLFEDSVLQAVRALSEERMQHIATLVKNGLTDEQQEYDQYKYLLSLFAQISDTEVIILHSYIYDEHGGEVNFFLKHQDILMAADKIHSGSSQFELDKATIHTDYIRHLVRLNLLQPTFPTIRKNDSPEFDTKTGMLKASGNRLTPLGRLLLRQLDIAKNE